MQLRAKLALIKSSERYLTHTWPNFIIYLPNCFKKIYKHFVCFISRRVTLKRTKFHVCVFDHFWCELEQNKSIKINSSKHTALIGRYNIQTIKKVFTSIHCSSSSLVQTFFGKTPSSYNKTAIGRARTSLSIYLCIYRCLSWIHDKCYRNVKQLYLWARQMFKLNGKYAPFRDP